MRGSLDAKPGITQEKFDTFADSMLPLTVVEIGANDPPCSALYRTGVASVGMRVESKGICTVAGVVNDVPCGVRAYIAPATSTPIEGSVGALLLSRGISMSTEVESAPAGTDT